MKKSSFDSNSSRRKFIKNGLIISSSAIGLHSYGSTLNIFENNLASDFTLPPLNYAFDALEPHIDAMTMQIHYTKHHVGYINNLNDAIKSEKYLQEKTLEKILPNLNSIPEPLRTKVRNNGGGHWNHSFFWEQLTPNNDTLPSEKLMTAINAKFDSFDNFKNEFEKAGLSCFGSGWVWLVRTNKNTLEMGSTPNQDNPMMDIAEFNGMPLLGVDVWEHAYYLKYQNKRAVYLKSIWNVIDWNFVSKKFEC